MLYRYPLSSDTWDDKEIEAMQSVIETRQFTMGEKTREFESAFAAKFGSKYAVMVNSGSSANLLMIAALIYSGKLKPGDEVLVPAVSWSTTYTPLIQFNLQLRFVDIDAETWNLDIRKMQKAVTVDTKAIFIVNLLGNNNVFESIVNFANENNLIIIEDNCESMGSMYKNRYSGTWGVMASFSTFYSHHISTMEGGVVTTDDPLLYEYLVCLRAHGWTRDLPERSLLYKKNEDEFYELFNFILPGYNFRPLELSAAIGIEQIKKLDGIIKQRRENAAYFKERMSRFNHILLQKEIGNSSWFGFGMILEKGSRSKIIKKMDSAGIQVRPIVAGNFIRNSVNQFARYSVSSELNNADFLHENGFFIGNQSVNISNKIDYVIDVLLKFN